MFFFFDDVRPLPYINCLEGIKIPGISGKEYQVEISSNFFMPFPPDPPHLRVASWALSFARLWLSSQALITYCGSLEGDTKIEPWIFRQIETITGRRLSVCVYWIVAWIMEEPYGNGVASPAFQLQLEHSTSSSQMSQKHPTSKLKYWNYM